jgi:hypothetical protein
MRKSILLLAWVILAMLLAGRAALAQTAPGEVPDASCQSPGDLGLGAAFRGDGPRAQTFTAEHTGDLTSAQVVIANNLTKSIVMSIHSVDASGKPVLDALASDVIQPSEVVAGGMYGPGWATATGHFVPGVPVEAGEQYAIGLDRIGDQSPPDAVWLGSTSDPCPGSFYLAESEGDAGMGFRLIDPRFDVYFLTFVTLPTTPQTKADCKRGDYRDFGYRNQGQCIKAVNHAS